MSATPTDTESTGARRVNRKLESALNNYARFGIRVIPLHEIESDGECSCGKLKCGSAGKHPRLNDWQILATTDEKIIDGWWRQWPGANIGVVCGQASDLLGADVDMKPRTDGTPRDGRSTLRALELEHGVLPECPHVLTPTGGDHYYLEHEDGLINGADTLGDGIDIKTNNGYLVGVGSIAPIAPGSKILKKYEFEVGYEISEALQPSKAPAWLVALARAAAAKSNAHTNGTGFKLDDGPIKEGSRNDLLYRTGRAFKARNLGAGEIRAGLESLNAKRCAPPLAQSEVEAILKSVLTEPDRPDFKDKAKQKPEGGLLGTEAVVVEPKDPEWEWDKRIPKGEVTMLDGDPGVGKSLLTVDLAARKSVGRPYPDGASCEAGNVIIVSAEDNDSTIVSRLNVHDAELSRIRIVTGAFESKGETYALTLPDHVGLLEDVITAKAAGLCIIDPLAAFISEKVDGHKDSSIRRVMAVLTRLAQKTRCAIICVRHLTKQAFIENALYRGGGSIAIIGSARAGFLVGFDPEDQAPAFLRKRIFAQYKANLGPITPSLAYGVSIAENEKVAHVEWLKGESKLHANDLLLMQGKKQRDPNALDIAKDFLKIELASGPHKSTEIEEKAKEAGISKKTLARARGVLRIVPDKDGAGGWTVSLPDNHDRRLPKDDQ